MTGLLDELDAVKAELDAFRAENARLREALLDAQGPMYVEFVRHLPVFRCEEEP